MRFGGRIGHVAARSNGRVIALFVKVENLEEIARRKGSALCPSCGQQYKRELAAAVRLVLDDKAIAHIAPVIYTCKPPHDFLHRRQLERLYDGKNTKGLHAWVYCIAYNALSDPKFVRHLLLCYPVLQDKPLTERTLQKAGCDLEKEIAFWQLAEGGEEEQ
jgi:hypothetical protein